MKTTKYLTVLLAAAFVATPALADYKYNMYNESFSVSIGVPAAGMATGALTTTSGYMVQAFSDAVYRAAQTGFVNALQGYLPSFDDYRGHSSRMSASRIELTLGPGQGGAASLQISGLTFGFTVYAKPHQGPFPADCSADVTLNNVSLRSDQADLVSGVVQNLQLISDAPIVNTSCSSSLGWIPGLGGLIDSYANGLFYKFVSTKIESQFAGSSAFSIKSTSFASLNSALPVGKVIVAGVDVGAFVRNNLSYLVNTGVTATLQKQPDTPIPSMNGWNIDTPWSPLIARFGDGTQVQIDGIRNYSPVWDPNCGINISCNEP
jgi:hypothetical protein